MPQGKNGNTCTASAPGVRFHGELFRLGSQRLGSTPFGSYGSASCGSTVRLLTTTVILINLVGRAGQELGQDMLEWH